MADYPSPEGHRSRSSGVRRTLARGQFPSLAYRLGRARATGVLAIYSASRPGASPQILVLRRGYLIAPGRVPAGKRSAAERAGRDGQKWVGVAKPATGRQTARRLAELAGLAGAQYSFDGGLAAYPPGAAFRQFSLAAWARSHIEAQFDAARAQRMLSELGGARLTAVPGVVPDPALCDEVDSRILEAIRVPRCLDDIAALARTPRFRLLSFLYFLRRVGGLEVLGIVAPAPVSEAEKTAREVLGVRADADRVTVKRAYRRLVRALHPDLHPGVSDARRRNLERKLAAVTSAYVELRAKQ